MYTMKLSSCGNPDYSQYAPVSEPKVVTGQTLDEMVRLAEEYRDENGLGGGNWMTPAVTENGKPVAWISYNGRLWDKNPDKVTL